MRLLMLSHLFFLLTTIDASSIGYGQTAPTHANTSALSEPHAQSLSVTECQGINTCASWMFTKRETGGLGIGKWPTGEEAVLKVSKFDQNSIVITRSDLSGTRPGLNATYTGTFQGGEVIGWYKSEYKGKTEYGPWYWVVNAASNTPLTLTVWGSDGSAPSLFTFKSSSPGTHGLGFFSNGVRGDLILDHLDDKTIVVSADTESVLGVSGAYTGHIDGDQITGTVLISDHGHHNSITTPWRGVFGDARGGSIVPGSAITPLDVLHGLHDAAIVISFFDSWY